MIFLAVVLFAVVFSMVPWQSWNIKVLRARKRCCTSRNAFSASLHVNERLGAGEGRRQAKHRVLTAALKSSRVETCPDGNASKRCGGMHQGAVE